MFKTSVLSITLNYNYFMIINCSYLVRQGLATDSKFGTHDHVSNVTQNIDFHRAR